MEEEMLEFKQQWYMPEIVNTLQERYSGLLYSKRVLLQKGLDGGEKLLKMLRLADKPPPAAACFMRLRGALAPKRLGSFGHWVLSNQGG